MKNREKNTKHVYKGCQIPYMTYGRNLPPQTHRKNRDINEPKKYTYHN